MKVIQHGKTFHKIGCPECEAAIGFLDKETNRRDYASDNIATITCPECGYTIVTDFYNPDEREWKPNLGITRYIN